MQKGSDKLPFFYARRIITLFRFFRKLGPNSASKLKRLSVYILVIVSFSCANEEIQERIAIDNPHYDQAVEYLEYGKVDSAFVAFDRAKELFIEAGDSLNVANSLIRMAIMLTGLNDYFGGQETSLEALNYLNDQNTDHHVYLASNFNNLGVATYHLRDFDRALDFYDSAIKYTGDSSDTLVYLNNKAKIYHDKGEFDKAIAIYEQILKEAKSQREYARILTNLTLSRWRQNPDADWSFDFLSALHIREQEKDLWGQNSSYTHLTDYYAERQSDSALFYAHKMYAAAKEIRSADDQIRALYRLGRLSPPNSTKHYFEIYTRLSDSVMFARASAKNQFALIRYEVEKNKAENLRLQKENAERNLQVSRQRVWTATVSLLTIALILGGTYWYRKRKQRLELEAQNRIKASQLHTSKKVHDVVANGLYRVMAEIENREDIDRERILDRLEDMYEKSRDISYEAEDPLTPPINYHQRVTDLLISFATDATKVLIVGNDPGVWEGIPAETRYETEHILQELMVNMKKHSKASHVAIRFEREGGRFSIYYSDNGVGLPADFQKGNGLINTGNRIKNLHGNLTFDTWENGLKIRMSFPLS